MANLPCDLVPSQPGDSVYLVLWYKKDDKTPIYRYWPEPRRNLSPNITKHFTILNLGFGMSLRRLKHSVLAVTTREPVVLGAVLRICGLSLLYLAHGQFSATWREPLQLNWLCLPLQSMAMRVRIIPERCKRRDLTTQTTIPVRTDNDISYIGEYTCRVDFRQSPTKYHRIRLTVIGKKNHWLLSWLYVMHMLAPSSTWSTDHSGSIWSTCEGGCAWASESGRAGDPGLFGDRR